jgi:hypothetical protein
MRTLRKREEFLNRVDFVRRLNAAGLNYHGLLRAKHAAEEYTRNPVAAPSPAAGPEQAAREELFSRDMAALLSPSTYGLYRGQALQPRGGFGVARPQRKRKPKK